MSGGLGTIVIGGGTGFIGSALVDAFQSIGSKVWVISRMPGPSQFTWHELNKEGLPPDTRVVINLAGQNILDPFKGWSSGFKQNVYSSRINTTSALAGAINRAEKKPEVFIQISGVGIYPYSETEVFDESSPGGDNYFSALVRDWEAAGTLPSNIPTRRVIIRSGVVLGQGGGMIKNIYIPFWLGLGGPIGNGNQWFPWIHLADMVRLFMFAAESDHVTGILNGVAPAQTTSRDFTRALGKAMWRPTLIPLPEFAINLAFGPERATMMTKGMRVAPKRALDLGYKFVFDNIHDACKEIAGGLSLAKIN